MMVHLCSNICGSKHFYLKGYMQTFINTHSTIVKTWKQPKCPIKDKWINNLWSIYVYTMDYYEIHFYEKKQNHETSGNMNGARRYHPE